MHHSSEILRCWSEQELPAKSRRAIDNMVAACDFLQDRQIPITVAGVGKFCEGREGGPRAQSIRNRCSYREYVVARRAEQRVNSPSLAKHMPVRCGDASIDSYIQTLELQVSHLETELRSMRKSFVAIREYDLDDAITNGELHSVEAAKFCADGEMISAVAALLDEKNLDSVGLALAPTGQIIAPELNGVVFLNKPGVDALKKFKDAVRLPKGRADVVKGRNASSSVVSDGRGHPTGKLAIKNTNGSR